MTGHHTYAVVKVDGRSEHIVTVADDRTTYTVEPGIDGADRPCAVVRSSTGVHIEFTGEGLAAVRLAAALDSALALLPARVS